MKTKGKITITSAEQTTITVPSPIDLIRTLGTDKIYFTVNGKRSSDVITISKPQNGKSF